MSASSISLLSKKPTFDLKKLEELYERYLSYPENMYGGKDFNETKNPLISVHSIGQYGLLIFDTRKLFDEIGNVLNGHKDINVYIHGHKDIIVYIYDFILKENLREPQEEPGLMYMSQLSRFSSLIARILVQLKMANIDNNVRLRTPFNFSLLDNFVDRQHSSSNGDNISRPYVFSELPNEIVKHILNELNQEELVILNSSGVLTGNRVIRSEIVNLVLQKREVFDVAATLLSRFINNVCLIPIQNQNKNNIDEFHIAEVSIVWNKYLSLLQSQESNPKPTYLWGERTDWSIARSTFIYGNTTGHTFQYDNSIFDPKTNVSDNYLQHVSDLKEDDDLSIFMGRMCKPTPINDQSKKYSHETIYLGRRIKKYLQFSESPIMMQRGTHEAIMAMTLDFEDFDVLIKRVVDQRTMLGISKENDKKIIDFVMKKTNESSYTLEFSLISGTYQHNPFLDLESLRNFVRDSVVFQLFVKDIKLVLESTPCLKHVVSRNATFHKQSIISCILLDFARYAELLGRLALSTKESEYSDIRRYLFGYTGLICFSKLPSHVYPNRIEEFENRKKLNSVLYYALKSVFEAAKW